MRIRKPNLIKQASAGFLSFILVLSMVSSAMPFFVSAVADAAPGYAETGSGFDVLTDVQIDRSAPSDGYVLDDSSLVLGVDGDNPAPNALASAFYRTEGINADLPDGTNSLKATLHVDADWATKIGVRAGMWGVTATNPSVFPILEFSNRDDSNDQIAGTPVIRAWDSATGWTNLISNPTYGASYTFEVVHDPADNTFKFFVNDSLLRTVSTVYGGSSHGPFGRIIFNNYNSGIASNDYSVQWTDFSVGQRSVASIDGTNYSSLQEAVAQSVAGDTIDLNEDITLSSTLINLNKANVTLNGNGNTITTAYAKGVNGVSNAAVQVLADGVTINDLVVESTHASPAHGINVFEADDITLRNVTLTNNAIGVLVNGSTVTVDGITSSGSKWGHAINVDKANAQLTITGTNSWNEPRFIYVDNVEVGDVEDPQSQYKEVLIPNLNNPAIMAAVYTAPDAQVDAKLPVTTANGVGTSAPVSTDMTIYSPDATVQIPSGTSISGQGWDGTITAPIVDTTVDATDISVPTGTTVSDVVAVRVGVTGIRLDFSSPVSVSLPGQAGKKAGFIDHTGVFHAITVNCGTDPLATLVGTVEECWTTDGGDLVIWTNHFTTFVAYNATAPTPVATTPSVMALPLVKATASSVSSFASIFNVTPATDSSTTQTSDVLGTQTKKQTAKTPVVEATNSGWKIVGLAWYWWILILAVLAALAVYVVTRRRNNA